MDLARHGTRPPPRPGTRGLSPCLPGRSAREGLGLPPAGTGGQRSRNSTPDARTVDQALQIPCPTFRKTASGPSTHWLQSRMPTSSDSRSSCARDRFICRHDRERELRDAATVRGREEINALLWAMARSIGPRPANSISRRRAETVRPPQSRDPSAAQGTRGYFRKSFPSGYIESNTNRVAGLPRWPPTRRCAACGVANGPTTLVSHVSFAGFPCGNAYSLEQALLGD